MDTNGDDSRLCEVLSNAYARNGGFLRDALVVCRSPRNRKLGIERWVNSLRNRGSDFRSYNFEEIPLYKFARSWMQSSRGHDTDPINSIPLDYTRHFSAVSRSSRAASLPNRNLERHRFGRDTVHRTSAAIHRSRVAFTRGQRA